jgi:predicted  nucleic acid-binding Zn-ribbon protein
MRDNMRMSQDKRRMSTVQYKQDRNQMEQEMNYLRSQLSSSDQERQAIAVQFREMQLRCQDLKDQFEARDVENSLNEAEMADQILQSEKQIEQLKSSNLSLVDEFLYCNLVSIDLPFAG